MELAKSQAIDYTAGDSELGEALVKQLAPNADGIGADPAPYIRRFDDAVGQQAHLLYWKLSLYEDPSDPTDKVMLLLDQVRQQSNRKISTGI